MPGTGARSLVQARLDDATSQALARLRKKTGLSDSELVRKALQVLDGASHKKSPPRIMGIGSVRSGIPDLGSNKKHLAGFGRS